DHGGAAAVAAEVDLGLAVGVAGERDELGPLAHAFALRRRGMSVGSSWDAGTIAWRARPSIRSRIWRCASPGDSASWRPAVRPRSTRPRRKSVICSGPAVERTRYAQRATWSSAA